MQPVTFNGTSSGPGPVAGQLFHLNVSLGGGAPLAPLPTFGVFAVAGGLTSALALAMGSRIRVVDYSVICSLACKMPYFVERFTFNGRPVNYGLPHMQASMCRPDQRNLGTNPYPLNLNPKLKIGGPQTLPSPKYDVQRPAVTIADPWLHQYTL